MQIFVVYYSMYGHIRQMAQHVLQGLEEAGAEGVLYQIPETLPQEVLDKMGAPPKDETVLKCAHNLCLVVSMHDLSLLGASHYRGRPRTS